MGKSAVSASTAKQGFQFNVVFKQGKIWNNTRLPVSFSYYPTDGEHFLFAVCSVPNLRYIFEVFVYNMNMTPFSYILFYSMIRALTAVTVYYW